MIKPTFHSGPRNLHRFAAISEIVSWVSLRFVRCPIPGNGNIWQHLATSGNNAWFIASQLVAPEVWQWIWTVQGITIIRRWACPSVCSRLWLLDFQLDLTPQLTYRWGWTSMNSRLIIWILLFGSRAIAIVPDCCVLSFFNLQPVSGSALSMTRGGILGFHHQFATRGSFLRIGSQIPRFSQCICGSLVFYQPHPLAFWWWIYTNNYRNNAIHPSKIEHLHSVPNLPLHGYGSIPINTIFSGMNIHLPAILGSPGVPGFWPIPTCPTPGCQCWEPHRLWDQVRGGRRQQLVFFFDFC